MDRLACLDTFVKVVEKGGFAAAARHLNLSPSAVTQQIQNLEGRLGVRLLNRTTRNHSLTEAGRGFYDRCVTILADLEDAETVASMLHSTARGTLRLNVSPTLAHHISALVGAYASKHPQTTFELTITGRMGSLVEGGFDLAVRADPLPDSQLISRRLGSASWSLCASPAYLAQRGEPSRPADLTQHNCLTYADHGSAGSWSFAGENGPSAIRVSGSLRSNDPEVLRAAALSGQGIALVPHVSIAAEVACGRLVRVLRAYPVEQAAVLAVFPSGQRMPHKVRCFIDFAARWFGASPPSESARRPDERAASGEARYRAAGTRRTPWMDDDDRPPARVAAAATASHVVPLRARRKDWVGSSRRRPGGAGEKAVLSLVADCRSSEAMTS